MSSFSKNCTILIRDDRVVWPTIAEMQKKLESSKDSDKIAALEDIILGVINGEAYDKLLMVVVRYVINSRNHRVKRLLHLFFEVVEKCQNDGELKDEIILACNAVLADLTSANEFVRGSTLRLLCKINHLKFLEPLMPSILSNLNFRVSYVRRNAVMCVYWLLKTFGNDVLPSALPAVEELLKRETDLSVKRNSFLLLLHCDYERALNYLTNMQASMTGVGDIFQLVLLELLRKVSRHDPSKKAALLHIIMNIANSSPPAVAYESSISLLSLSSSSAALKAATKAFVELLIKQADNNVKLIVLDRIVEILKKHRHVLEEFVLDILRALNCPSLEVHTRALEIALQLLTPYNAKDVLNVLKRELVKTMDFQQQTSTEKLEYRRLLIGAMHTACSRFPDVSELVFDLLMDFLTDGDSRITTEVVLFAREIVANYPSLRVPILTRIADMFKDIQQSSVIQVCLWIFGQYATSFELVQMLIQDVYNGLCPLSAISENVNANEAPASIQKAESNSMKGLKLTTRTVVLEDGTYGTEEVYCSEDGRPKVSMEECSSDINGNTQKNILRGLILAGDFLLCSSLAVSFTRMTLRKYTIPELTDTGVQSKEQQCPPPLVINQVTHIVATLLRFVREHSCGGTECDTAIRLNQCLKALLQLMRKENNFEVSRWELLFDSGSDVLPKVLEIEMSNNENFMVPGCNDTDEQNVSEPSDKIFFRQLVVRGDPTLDGLEEEAPNMMSTIGSDQGISLKEDLSVFQERLAKVQPMTGLADPIYVEAFVQVLQFDLVLELLVINRTQETLQNVEIEIFSHGDMKVIDRPSATTLAAQQQVILNASIKVHSMIRGVIFGFVVYDRKGAGEKEYIYLNELHVEILEYINRTWIGEMAFRSMWSEFEWENKLNIDTRFTDFGEFLEHIMRHTNMTVVGKYGKPPKGSEGLTNRLGSKPEEVEKYLSSVKELPMLKDMTDSSYFAANLYSRSIFGEDALANVSIEKLPDGKLGGSVRIRSRTQGVALSLGDRITLLQGDSVF